MKIIFISLCIFLWNQLKLKYLSVTKIFSLFYTSILLLILNTSYFCDNLRLDLVIRNNINGDFSIIKTISEIEPGSFINIDWNNKKLMLPYSLRNDFLSFTDKKWDWRYQISPNGLVIQDNPALYELLPSGEIKEHLCRIEES